MVEASIEPTSSSVILNYTYNLVVFTTNFSLAYSNSTLDYAVAIELGLVRISRIETSANDNGMILQLENIANSASVNINQFQLNSATAPVVYSASATYVQLLSYYSIQSISEVINLSYTYNSSNIPHHFGMMKLITLSQIEHVNGSSTRKLTFINIDNPSSATLSQFTFNDSITPTSIQVNGDDLVLVVPFTTSGTPFEAYFSPNSGITKAVIGDATFVDIKPYTA